MRAGWESAEPGVGILSARYRAKTGSVIANPAGLPDAALILMQSDGNRFLAGWSAGNALSVQGIDDVDGTLFPAAPVLVADLSAGFAGTATGSFDGTDHVIAWRTGAGDIRGQMLSPDVALDNTVFDVASTTSDAAPFIASNTYGRSLVAFQRPQEPPSTDPGLRAVGVFIDNDLGPGTPEPDAGPDVVGDAADDAFDGDLDALDESQADSAEASQADVVPPDANEASQPDAAFDVVEDSVTGEVGPAGPDASADGPAGSLDAMEDRSDGTGGGAGGDSHAAASEQSDSGGCACHAAAAREQTQRWTLLALLTAAACLARRRRTSDGRRA